MVIKIIVKFLLNLMKLNQDPELMVDLLRLKNNSATFKADCHGCYEYKKIDDEAGLCKSCVKFSDKT